MRTPDCFIYGVNLWSDGCTHSLTQTCIHALVAHTPPPIYLFLLPPTLPPSLSLCVCVCVCVCLCIYLSLPLSISISSSLPQGPVVSTTGACEFRTGPASEFRGRDRAVEFDDDSIDGSGDAVGGASIDGSGDAGDGASIDGHSAGGSGHGRMRAVGSYDHSPDWTSIRSQIVPWLVEDDGDKNSGNNDVGGDGGAAAADADASVGTSSSGGGSGGSGVKMLGLESTPTMCETCL